MLTISEVALKYNLSNRQVHEMVRYGYLNVANIQRHSGRGSTYLFSENEVNNLDIHSILRRSVIEKNIAHLIPLPMIFGD